MCTLPRPSASISASVSCASRFSDNGDDGSGTADAPWPRRSVRMMRWWRDSAGKQTIGELITEFAVKVKENVSVRRFSHFRVGEER